MFFRPERFTCPPAVLLIWSQFPVYGMLIHCRPERLTWPLLLAEMAPLLPQPIASACSAERLRTVPTPVAESVGLPPAFEVYDVTAAGSVHVACPLKAKLELSIVVSAGATKRRC